ncbi:MAG: tetratricopeptide repeat protein, partial [Fibrobacterota bacterium]
MIRHRPSMRNLTAATLLLCGLVVEGNCGADLDSLVSEALRPTAEQAGPNPRMLAAFRKAVDSSAKDPRSYRSALAAGRAAFYLEKDSEARRYLDLAISIAPDSVGGHYYSGVLHRFAGASDKAIAEFERAYQADRTWIVALREKAEVQANSGGDDEALATARRILTADSSNIDGLYLVGILLAGKGDSHGAVPYFAKTVAIDSAYKDALYNYGQSLQLNGSAKEAEPVFRSLHARQKSDWKILAKLEQVSYAQGKDSGANAYASELYALRKSGQVPELQREKMFVREQFQVGRRKVFALEYFDLVGDRAVRYSFKVKD